MKNLSKFSRVWNGKKIPVYGMELTKKQWEEIKDKRPGFVSNDGKIALEVRNEDGSFRNTVFVTIAFV
jgi:hypothetical protein